MLQKVVETEREVKLEFPTSAVLSEEKVELRSGKVEHH